MFKLMFKFAFLILPLSHALSAVNSDLPAAVDTVPSSFVGDTASSVTGSDRPPPCTPTFVLQGVSEDDFNKPNTPFNIRPSCNSLDTESHAVFLATGADSESFLGLGAVLGDTVVARDGITVNGLGPGYKAITVTAKDDQGNSLIDTFALFFGSVTMPVKVLDENGKPVPGANVTAEAFPGVRQHGVTDGSGTVNMSNLPAMFVELSASAPDRRVGSSNTLATSSTATLKLVPTSHPLRRGAVVEPSPVLGPDTRCSTDNSDSAICQPMCQSPPPKSCDFYTRCAEETLHCGEEGYPVHYGARNCRRFVARLDSFSSRGQTWIWSTMLCLQRFLVEPISAKDSTCEMVKTQAFESHPRCYVDSGFCDLPLIDIIQVVVTVNFDLFQGPAFKQAASAAGGCARLYVLRVFDKIDQWRRSKAKGGGTAVHFNKMAVLEHVQAYLERFGSPDFD
ncbi:hypothetical protein G6O67_005056 [Ophiocordyceps sinensis]|uniref:Uncharacterized protein n=2 Tax=Ophiocordyceps sinensis TaxID=72228 RepID=A0A8H4V5I6_9HYPO|nr:Protein W01A8.8 [Ophiocordyceps sinensis CO18]KAF4508713.1 hypothetical protein G6O67_005056 [Ophiocordyceps sinensis]